MQSNHGRNLPRRTDSTNRSFDDDNDNIDGDDDNKDNDNGQFLLILY